MSSSHLKTTLPNLSIISPISCYCQHNRQARITDRSFWGGKNAKIGTHHLSFSIFLSISSPPHPSTQISLGGRRGKRRMGRKGEWKTLCIWKCPERGVIYVCIRCRFHYGPVAQVRSFQEHRGDLIRLRLITGHTGSRETTDGEERQGVATEGLKKYRRHIYNLDTHASPTGRE